MTRLSVLSDQNKSRRFHAAALFTMLFLVGAAWFGICGIALAQHPGAAGTAPPPQPGNGELTVQVRHNTNEAVVAGLSIALYALGPNGNPGFLSSLTDDTGLAQFQGISTNPDIVYLIGASFGEIPFGERMTFAPGETSVHVEIEISSPTEQVNGVGIEELRARIDWMGDRILVREVLRVVNASENVILIPKDSAARSIAARRLPARAEDFSAGATAIGDGLVLEDGEVLFRGPLYPGEQRVEYQYTLPINVDGRSVTLPIAMREAITRVVIVAGTPGLEASGAELIASSSVTSDSGQSLAAWARGRLAKNQNIEITIKLPDTRHDPNLVTIPRTDIWLELDDARLTANVDVKFHVPPGTPVSGTPEAPLLRVSLPTGASLNGVAPEAEALGLIPTENGGFVIVGPIAPGETSLGYSYQIPATRDGVQLDMHFSREVGTLNVLIEDTVLKVESSRLHRRRPFRRGTRKFLHREAYQVSAEEVVDLRISPIRGGDIPRAASGAMAFLALVGGVYFLVTPLISARRPEPDQEQDSNPIQSEREMIYANIRDLDHDFETGKIIANDYHPMRDELRQQAIDLLRLERQGQMDTSPPSTSSSTSASTLTSESTIGSAAAPTTHLRTGAFCPACGGAAKAEWKFCTDCGGRLEPGGDTQPEDAPTESEA